MCALNFFFLLYHTNQRQYDRVNYLTNGIINWIPQKEQISRQTCIAVAIKLSQIIMSVPTSAILELCIQVASTNIKI